MKDKRSVQVKDKKRHLATIRDTKARRKGQPVLERTKGTRPVKPTFLIVCEGENTEPSYFGQFKLSSATIRAVGSGCNTVSLVNQAIALSQENRYDQVWCVFDKDQFSARDFNKAVALAQARHFGVAYSNQAFEYWFILHFEDHQGGAMHRNEYAQILRKHLEPLAIVYDAKGSKRVNEAFFNLLNGLDTQTKQSRVQLAIRRARRNDGWWNDQSPARKESSTTVFRLVEEMIKYI